MLLVQNYAGSAVGLEFNETDVDFWLALFTIKNFKTKGNMAL